MRGCSAAHNAHRRSADPTPAALPFLLLSSPSDAGRAVPPEVLLGQMPSLYDPAAAKAAAAEAAKPLSAKGAAEAFSEH